MNGVQTPARTSEWRKILLISLAVCVVAATGVAAYTWYYEHYEWPRKIQTEILGQVIVDHSSFQSFEGSSHWGQGMFRWRYTAPPAAVNDWRKYCGSQAIEKCEFILSGQPEEDVKTSVSYKDGVVTIEEWWM